MRRFNKNGGGLHKYLFSLATISALISPNLYADSNASTEQKIKKDLLKRIQAKEENKSTIIKKKSMIPTPYGVSLYKLIQLEKGEKGYIEDKTPMELSLTIKFDRVKKELPSGAMSAIIDKKGKDTIFNANGTKLTKDDIIKINNGILNRSKKYVEKKKKSILKALKALKKDKYLLADSFIDAAIEKKHNTFKIELRKGDIKKFVKKNLKYISSISLLPQIQPSLTQAMVDTRVDPYALNYGGRTGEGVGIFTHEECPAEDHISQYTCLSTICNEQTDQCDDKSHGENVTAILRGVSPDSYIYTKGNGAALFPTDSEKLGTNGNPKIVIESYSTQMYYGSDQTGWTHTQQYRDTDKDADNEVFDHDIAVFVAAGNDDIDVATPGKGFNVITVGNYDDSNNQINSSSSYIDPETGVEKPEISAPGTFIAAGGHTMTGTSMAAPHAAAFAANFLSMYPWLKNDPSMLKAIFLATSTKAISGDDSTYRSIGNRTGVGGLDFRNAIYNSNYYWWWGDFDGLAANDNGQNSSNIEVTKYFSSGQHVRMALTWLNDGDYTLNHRTDAHPIGKDYDLRVYDPNGQYVNASTSYDNSFEVIDFVASTSGNYRILINEFDNRDTNTPMTLTLCIDRP